MLFNYQKLRAPTNNTVTLRQEVAQGQHYSGQLWGVFGGLFGVAANELLVVSATQGEDAQAFPERVDDTVVVNEIWQPTARPQSTAPCDKPGLYVFRRFHVMLEHVDEFVLLSQQAWQTFEHINAYAAEPMGLFQPPPDADGVARMMLVTWYDSFSAWETSRTPAPAAQENFQRRHGLTLTTYAVATRLLSA